VKYVKLTDEQHETIITALRSDYKTAEALGALPIGAEIQGDIKNAYLALQADSDRLFDGDDVDAIARTVVAKSRGTMRQVIGDVTPRQYDKADQMAGGIITAVREALAEFGVYNPIEAVDANVG
jgi:hypothetical protein